MRRFYGYRPPRGGDLVLTAHRFGLETAGPHVAVVAGLHGDEVNGVYVAARLVARLSELPPEAFGGKVSIVPAVNVFGVNTGTRFWPFDDTDINRMFPGYAEGETTQRIAARVTAALSGATHLVDIHSSNEALREMPHVRLYDQGAEIVEEAGAFGLPLVWRRTPGAAVAGQFAYTFGRRVPRTYILQGGSARRINKRFADQLTAGVCRFLTHVGAVRDGAVLPTDPSPEAAHVVTRAGIGFCFAPDAGIFVTHAEVGQSVHEGQLLGEIVSPLDGAILGEVRAPGAGRVMTLRVYPVVYENDLLARVVLAQPALYEEDEHAPASVREDYEMQ